MDFCFSFGIHHTYDELSVMRPGGCYWVNIQRHGDARQLCRQIVGAQGQRARAALICCGESPMELLSSLPFPNDGLAGPPDAVPLFTLPAKKAALTHFSADLIRAMHIRSRLLIFMVPAGLWKDFSQREIGAWLREIHVWLLKYNATLLILSYGSGINKLKNQLLAEFHDLAGLSSLLWQQDSAQYQVAWWFGGKGLMANQAMTWETNQHQEFVQLAVLPAYTPSVNDELLCLAEKSVLEGAPPLSEHWRLLDNNALLTQQGMQAHSATLVFSLEHNDGLSELAHNIHALRRQRGAALKIVVREMNASLRYTDERLLQICGANLVVPHITPLSSFLTLLEGIQGQQFTRHVPATIDLLLSAINPLHLKGLVSNEVFCAVLPSLIDNPLMPENGKGILVALRPVPGLLPQQAAALCHPRRTGDLVTVTAKRIYIFLSNCRLNDLDTALDHIFRLPIGEVFSNRLIWHHDVQILNEIHLLSGNSRLSGFPAADTPDMFSPVPGTPPPERPTAAEHLPIPLALSLTPASKGHV